MMGDPQVDQTGLRTSRCANLQRACKATRPSNLESRCVYREATVYQACLRHMPLPSWYDWRCIAHVHLQRPYFCQNVWHRRHPATRTAGEASPTAAWSMPMYVELQPSGLPTHAVKRQIKDQPTA